MWKVIRDAYVIVRPLAGWRGVLAAYYEIGRAWIRGDLDQDVPSPEKLPAPDYLWRKTLDQIDAWELDEALRTLEELMGRTDDMDAWNDIHHWIFCLQHEDPRYRLLPANRECEAAVRALRRCYPPLTDPE